MDHTYGVLHGQLATQNPSAQRDIETLCGLVHFLRAWWGAFEDTIRQVDRVAAAKAYDAIVDATILARRLARDLGFSLPDFSAADWSTSVRPVGHAQSTVDF